LAPHASHVEADLGDAANLAFAVGQRVERHALAVLQHLVLARLAEIDAAGQFTHDQDIQPRYHFRLEAGGPGQLRIQQRRTQVAEQAQLRTDLQQTTLWTDGRVDLVPLRATYRAKQNRIGLARALQGLVGQRYTVLVDSRTAQLVIAQFEPELELGVGQLQYLDRLGDDFRTDTIARENQNLFAHHVSLSR